MGVSGLGPDIIVRQIVDDFGNIFAEIKQGENDILAAEWLPFVKHYMGDGLNFCLPLEGLPAAVWIGHFGLNRVAVNNAVVRNNHDSGVRRDGRCSIEQFGVECIEVLKLESGKACDGNDELVLVANVQDMQSAESFIPARIRLKLFNPPEDICASEVGISIRDGALKSIGPVCEGKLHAFGSRSFVSDHSKHKNVESGAQIVDGISNRERDIVRNGLVGFDAHNALVELWVVLNDQAHWSFSDIHTELPVNIADVILGPFDL